MYPGSIASDGIFERCGGSLIAGRSRRAAASIDMS